MLGRFRYGPSGLLARLFRPRIETLLFAVSKADHVAHNQHHNLRLLLERMVDQAARAARFEGLTPAFVALAALRSTDVVRTEHHGPGAVLRARRDQRPGARDGTVPGRDRPICRPRRTGAPMRFRFCDFAPRRLLLHGAAKPQHIRLDQALEALIGDRLR